MTTRFALVSIVVFFSIFINGAAAAQCLSSAETRSAIEQGHAQHLAAIKVAASKAVRGDVVKANLCRSGAGLVYELVTLSREGAVARITLDAKSGRVLSKGGG
ncbi:PepSY domain-containing protein [Cohaesibacter sp. ES.047]|uniref:PepSY domain-containing protein n=1 Tax=Cohaesibacter sp. ES.047 TaxID=1798205 RepID=UPI000BB6C437|nr:hypothetical protein [Cohaesibacter sp. ES.047]